MKELSKNYSDSLNTYIDENRDKIDEALVSLRLMKEIDDFMEINKISQRDFADKLFYTESFVSQLMSGTKKINTKFINRFEKTYDLKIEFKIKPNDSSDFISRLTSNSTIQVNVEVVNLITTTGATFSHKLKSNEYTKYNDLVF